MIYVEPDAGGLAAAFAGGRTGSKRSGYRCVSADGQASVGGSHHRGQTVRNEALAGAPREEAIANTGVTWKIAPYRFTSHGSDYAFLHALCHL